MLCYRLSVVIVLRCYLCCSVIIVLFFVLIVCTVTLPPGVNPIAVDKCIYLMKTERIFVYKINKTAACITNSTDCHCLNSQKFSRLTELAYRRQFAWDYLKPTCSRMRDLSYCGISHELAVFASFVSSLSYCFPI